MPLDSDETYFIRRAEQERRLADRAACPSLQSLHRQFAARYDERAEQARAMRVDVEVVAG